MGGCRHAAGFCGDVVMQRIFFEQHAVLVAIGIFGLGHLAYLLPLRMTPPKDENYPSKPWQWPRAGLGTVVVLCVQR